MNHKYDNGTATTISILVFFFFACQLGKVYFIFMPDTRCTFCRKKNSLRMRDNMRTYLDIWMALPEMALVLDLNANIQHFILFFSDNNKHSGAYFHLEQQQLKLIHFQGLYGNSHPYFFPFVDWNPFQIYVITAIIISHHFTCQMTHGAIDVALCLFIC